MVLFFYILSFYLEVIIHALVFTLRGSIDNTPCCLPKTNDCVSLCPARTTEERGKAKPDNLFTAVDTHIECQGAAKQQQQQQVAKRDKRKAGKNDRRDPGNQSEAQWG